MESNERRLGYRILLAERDARTISTLREGLGSDFELLIADHPLHSIDEMRGLLERRDLDAMIIGSDLLGDEWRGGLRELREVDSLLPMILLVDEAPTSLVPILLEEVTDFVRKPIDIRELETRLQTLLRERERVSAVSLEFGGIRLDRERHEAHVHSELLPLTRLEFRLLERLLSSPEIVHTRSTLLREIWGLDFDPGTNVIDVHIANLRRKLRQSSPDAQIVTVRGVGFRLTRTAPQYT